MSYWEHARPVRRVRALDPEAIARAAVRILDVSGIDGLSLRALANALETAPASLYSRINGISDALDLALDHALERDGVVQRAVREEEASEILLSLYRHLLEHPWAVQVIAMRPPRGPAYLAFSECLSERLGRSGAAAPLSIAYSATNLVIGSAITHRVARLEPRTPGDASVAPVYEELRRAPHDPEEVLRQALHVLLANA
ncbi:hypothetical protein [Streptomyces sp. ML-6]|uniref:TetR/AcrR family transcriptional regulator n=1 Tax=Streptomyces sp. ML-6 TaxID=2982693 RepID=UPI0024C0273A|nr:hypothetical protein [Streptomyces sp. ML-6]MDK0524288.1 hypothetical protein [Streptomyces sp. ML-6]